MEITGHLRKMQVELGHPVRYRLPLDDQLVSMNEWIGQDLHITSLGEIHCIACGRKTNKSFNQGYCYPCMQRLPECDSCIIKPELCHYFEGTCRDASWGEQHCIQDHIVYLANSSGIKVGITRHTQIPTRWIDQGATQALPIIRAKNRLLSGHVEVIIKQHVADKTHWQRMLKGAAEGVDLIARREELLQICAAELNQLKQDSDPDSIHLIDDKTIVDIQYPVLEYPEKIKSFNLDKTPHIGGKLNGIKGQYLIFDSGVINIRKFAGYRVMVTTGSLET